MRQTLKEIPVNERPYEKLTAYGPAALSDAELLAIILKSGCRDKTAVDLAREILSLHPEYKGISGLYHLDASELKRIAGIGSVKTLQLMAVCELSKRMARSAALDKLSYKHPSTIADYYMESMRHLGREEIHVMLFDSRYHLMHEMRLTQGTANGATITPRELFSEALRREAVFVILIHNHPSGNPEPSREDIQFTKRIKDAGDVIGIALSDHIIIGDKCYVSLRERGYIL